MLLLLPLGLLVWWKLMEKHGAAIPPGPPQGVMGLQRSSPGILGREINGPDHPLAALLGRYFLAHRDWSVPQPVGLALDQVKTNIRELNYLKRPELDNLVLPDFPADGSGHVPLVACPLPEPSLLVLLQWFAAQMRSDLVFPEKGGIQFDPWKETPDGPPFRVDVPIQPAWLSPPRGDSADPAADALLPLSAAGLLHAWGIAMEDEAAANLSHDLRTLRLYARPSELRQASTLARLRQQHRPPVFGIALHLSAADQVSEGGDAIVETTTPGQGVESDGFQVSAGSKGSSGSAASGQTLVLEQITPVGPAGQPDWAGLWAGLQLRAEGEVVRISGRVEHRPVPEESGETPAQPLDAAEAEFEAMIPRGFTAVLVLDSPADGSPVKAAISVE